MKPEDFDAWASLELAAVESALDSLVPEDTPAGLGDAMRYAVLDGGKRWCWLAATPSAAIRPPRCVQPWQLN